MPITEFQITILQLLAKNRNPNSFVAGGIAIHRHQNSSRYSKDIDFFHDIAEGVKTASAIDIQHLQASSYLVEVLLDQPSFVRAVIKKNDQSVKLEWVHDTAFRFFPVIEDALLGYRLHDIDLAVNKCLALANRNEVRDIIDLIELNKNVLSLSATIWAACGKDPGFTPDLLIDCIQRHSIIRSEQLDAEDLVAKINAVELKRLWLSELGAAEEDLKKFPPEDLGCLYLDEKGNAAVNPERLMSKQLHKQGHKQAQKHFGSVSGSWPRILQ